MKREDRIPSKSTMLPFVNLSYKKHKFATQIRRDPRIHTVSTNFTKFVVIKTLLTAYNDREQLDCLLRMDRTPNQRNSFAFRMCATSMLEPFHKMQPSKYKQLNMPYALSKKALATTTNESQKQTKAQRKKVSKKTKTKIRMSSPKPKTNAFSPATWQEKHKICNVNESHWHIYGFLSLNDMGNAIFGMHLPSPSQSSTYLESFQNIRVKIIDCLLSSLKQQLHLLKSFTI